MIRVLSLMAWSLAFWTASTNAELIELKSGGTLECESAVLESDVVVVKVKSGTIRLPVDLVAESTLQRLRGAPTMAAPAPAAELPPQPPTEAPQPPAPATENEPAPVPKPTEAPPPSLPKFPPPPAPAGFARHAAAEFPKEFPDPDPSVKVLRDELKLTSKAKGMEQEAVAQYRIPLKADKTPGPHAHTVVFYCPFINDSTTVDGREQLALSDLLGFTVISFKIHTNFKELNNPEKTYWMPEAGWYDLVWEAVDKVRSKHQLKPEKIFLWGNSSGSGWAQRLTVRHPDRVEAVALMGGSGFEKMTQPTGARWLVMNTAGASETSDNQALVANLQQLGDPVIHVQPPPWREARGTGNYLHTAGALAVSLMQSFFWGLTTTRLPDGASTPQAQWAYAASTEPPYTVFKRQTPDASLTAPFTLLPSESMAYFWNQLPNPVHATTVTAGGKSFRLYQALPKSDRLKGIVLTTTEYSILNYPAIAGDLAHWAELGYAAIGLRQPLKAPSSPPGAGPPPSPPDVLAAWLQQHPEHASLPIYLSARVGDTVPLPLLVPAPWRPKIKGMVVSGLNLDMKDSELKKAIADLGLNPPTLAIVRAGYDPKLEDAEKMAKKAQRDIQKAGLHLRAFLLPPSEANPEKERYYAIAKGGEFFAGELK
jgi:pimeloyl-ACP methyl ester carboxylesterase